MKGYIERFNNSYYSARQLKQEIYSLKIPEIKRDELWETIVLLCMSKKECKWYFEYEDK